MVSECAAQSRLGDSHGPVAFDGARGVGSSTTGAPFLLTSAEARCNFSCVSFVPSPEEVDLTTSQVREKGPFLGHERDWGFSPNSDTDLEKILFPLGIGLKITEAPMYSNQLF